LVLLVYFAQPKKKKKKKRRECISIWLRNSKGFKGPIKRPEIWLTIHADLFIQLSGSMAEVETTRVIFVRLWRYKEDPTPTIIA
jgi:hypothetical protein